MEFGRVLCRSVSVCRSSWTWRSCNYLQQIHSPSRLLSASSFNSLIPSKYSKNICTKKSISTHNTITYFSTRPSAPTITLGQSPFVTEKNTFKDSQKPHQFLLRDKKTIVCVHPAQPTPLAHTKPLRPLNPSVKEQKDSLTNDEVKLVKKLRAMDGALWTVNTLARHFNVKRGVISKVAPATLERQRELDKEKTLTSAMRPYKRKLYKAQKQMERQKRLEEIVSKNREKLGK